jgi:hypothetical protein
MLDSFRLVEPIREDAEYENGSDTMEHPNDQNGSLPQAARAGSTSASVVFPRKEPKSVAEVQPVADPDQPPRLTIGARYDRWRQLIEGRLDVGRAVLFRQVRISGQLSALRRDLDDARPLTEALREVETTWLEEA